jgi:hypothetical protein
MPRQQSAEAGAGACRAKYFPKTVKEPKDKKGLVEKVLPSEKTVDHLADAAATNAPAGPMKVRTPFPVAEIQGHTLRTADSSSHSLARELHHPSASARQAAAVHSDRIAVLWAQFERRLTDLQIRGLFTDILTRAPALLVR